MANKDTKQSDNVPGIFYVDAQCIDCDECRGTAPNHFRRNDDKGHSYVYRQPETADEIDLCEEALEKCPVDAIGQDGKGSQEDPQSLGDGLPIDVSLRNIS